MLKSKILLETGRVEHLPLTHQQSNYDTANKESPSPEFNLWKSSTTFIPRPVYKIQIRKKKKLALESDEELKLKVPTESSTC